MKDRFDLGDILMVAAVAQGKSCPTARLTGLSDLVNFMTGHPQVPYDPVVLNWCGTALVAQHPWIAELEIPDFENTGENEKERWLDKLAKKHGGMYLEVEDLEVSIERSPQDFLDAAGIDARKILNINEQNPESVTEALNILKGKKPPKG